MDKLERVQVSGMGREEWLEERRKSLGGSDVGAILGLNPYRSAYTVWADKTGRLPEQPDNEAMRQGRDLEGYVAGRFAERSGRRVERLNYMLRNPRVPYLHASIDRRVVGERAGLECKTASALSLKAYQGGKFPESYYAQCVAYLAVTGWERWYLAALVLNKAFYVYQLTTLEDEQAPDWCDGSVYVPPSELSALCGVAKNFWENHVLTGRPPAPDGSPATTDALRALYAGGEGGEVDLFGKGPMLEEYFSIGSEVERLDARREAIKQGLMEAMGDAERGRCGPYKVTWKGHVRRNLSNKLIKEKHPGIDLGGCYTESAFRVFKIMKED